MTRARISQVQESWLLLVEAADRCGVSLSARHPSLNALQRRGLVEPLHCRSGLNNRRWVATSAGRGWVKGRAR